MIKIYPIEIEAVDDDGEPVFKLKAVDENNASLTVDALISPGNVDDFCRALSKAIIMLELEPIHAFVSTTTD